jgi:Domain of unknown function (DUF4939)
MAPRDPSPTPSATSTSRRTPSSTQEMIVSAKELRVPLPPCFDGTRGQLKTFLLQVELYMSFFPTKFNTDKQRVLWTTTLLKGPALNWIEVYVDDYMVNNRNAKQQTMELIENWGEFREQLATMFGDIDEEHAAEQSLRRLTQKGPASGYAADFRRYSIRTRWNDDALKYQFYFGLKDSVKDEMARTERPEELEKMIESAIAIDNRMYERQLERRGGSSYHSFAGNRKPAQKPQRNTQPYYGPMPMDLSAATQQQQVSKAEMDRRRQNKLCFKCGKAGHQSKWHYQKGKTSGDRRPQRLAATGRRGYNGNKKEIATMQIALMKTASSPEGSDRTTYFDTSELDEQLEMLLDGYDNHPTEEQKQIDLRIAAFLDKYDSCSNMSEYRARYGEPTSVLDHVLPHGGLTATLAAGPPFTPMDLQGAYNLVSFSGDMESLAEYQEIQPSRVSKFIEKLGNDSDSQDDYDYALSASEEKHLEQVVKEAAEEYRERKNARLDATQPDHPRHNELGFESCAHDECPDHRASKEAYYFPEVTGPVYLSRDTHQICALTAVDEEEDGSEGSDDTETEDDKKLREAWDEVSSHARKNKSNIEVAGMKNGKVRRVIRIEIPDSDEESEDDESTELDDEEQAIWKEIQRMQVELTRYKEVHRRIQHKIARFGGDVGVPNHPKHPEMCHRFCGHDGCQVHLDRKVKDAYFSGKKEPIYWVKVVRDSTVENIEHVSGPGWADVVDEQRRFYALNY